MKQVVLMCYDADNDPIQMVLAPSVSWRDLRFACVAVCWGAVCCSVLQCVAVRCSELQCNDLHGREMSVSCERCDSQMPISLMYIRV